MTADKYVDLMKRLNTYSGLLEALFTFGNTLELLYVGGSIYEPLLSKEDVAGGDIIHNKDTLIPLYIDFKSKKCH